MGFYGTRASKISDCFIVRSFLHKIIKMTTNQIDLIKSSRKKVTGDPIVAGAPFYNRHYKIASGMEPLNWRANTNKNYDCIPFIDFLSLRIK